MTSQTSSSDLNSFVKLLWRRRTVVMGTALAALAIVVVLDFLVRDRQYESRAEILVTNSLTDLVSGGGSDDLDRIMRNELVVAESRAVRAPIEEKYGQDIDVTVEITEGQDVLEITAVDSNAASAAQLAADYAASYLTVRESAAIDEFGRMAQVVSDQIEDLDAQIDALPATATTERTLLQNRRALLVQRLNEVTLSSDLVEGGTARIVSEPFAADSPVSPNPIRDAVLAVALGLMAGIGLAYLRELIDKIGDDDSIQVAESLQGLSVLVELPRLRHDPALAILDDRAPSFNEAARHLATSVGFTLPAGKSQVLQVMAAVAGEGKSTVAANLAIALAERRNRVLLVDGDLRSPGLTSLFGIDPDRFRGLADLVLEEPARRTYTVAGLAHQRSELLSILPAGMQRSDAIVGLRSDRLEPLYHELATGYDYVIVDSSPLLAVTDGALLARHADLRLLVVGPNATAVNILNTRALLDHLRLGIGGVVLNRQLDQPLRQYGSGAARSLAADRALPGRGRRASDGPAPSIATPARLPGADGANGFGGGPDAPIAAGGDQVGVDAIAHLLDELAPTMGDRSDQSLAGEDDTSMIVTASQPAVGVPQPGGAPTTTGIESQNDGAGPARRDTPEVGDRTSGPNSG